MAQSTIIAAELKIAKLQILLILGKWRIYFILVFIIGEFMWNLLGFHILLRINIICLCFLLCAFCYIRKSWFIFVYSGFRIDMFILCSLLMPQNSNWGATRFLNSKLGSCPPTSYCLHYCKSETISITQVAWDSNWVGNTYNNIGVKSSTPI